jgi:hypothetical protein
VGERCLVESNQEFGARVKSGYLQHVLHTVPGMINIRDVSKNAMVGYNYERREVMDLAGSNPSIFSARGYV